jgi:acyl carrier protein
MEGQSLAIGSPLELESVRQKIAELIHDNLDITVEKVLEDTPFKELHKDFDSLTFLEVQLLLEKEYGFEFQIDFQDKNAKIPKNATELATELIKQHAAHLVREKAKSEAKAIKALAAAEAAKLTSESA